MRIHMVGALWIAALPLALAVGCQSNAGLVREVTDMPCKVVQTNGLELASNRKFVFGKQYYANRMVVGEDGSVYVAGGNLDRRVTADLEPVPVEGFLAKLDGATVVWVRDVLSGSSLGAADVDVGPDNTVYVVTKAPTDEAVLYPAVGRNMVLKYDTHGRLLWRSTFGTAMTGGRATICVAHNGDCYVAGTTQAYGEEDRGDVYLAFLNEVGQLQWQVQFGSDGADHPYDMALQEPGQRELHVVGSTRGDLAAPNAGQEDVFVAQYARNGWQKAIRQFGGPGSDRGVGVVTDGPAVLVRSHEETAQASHAVLSRFNARAGLEWRLEFRESLGRDTRAIAVDDDGNCYLAYLGYESPESWDDPGRTYLAIVGVDPGGQVSGSIELNTDCAEVRDLAVDRRGNVYVLCSGEFDYGFAVFRLAVTAD